MAFKLYDRVFCIEPHKGWLENGKYYRVINIKRACHIDLVELEGMPEVWWNEKRFKPSMLNFDTEYCNYCDRYWTVIGHRPNCPELYLYNIRNSE